jgi:hypothetical protein
MGFSGNDPVECGQLNALQPTTCYRYFVLNLLKNPFISGFRFRFLQARPYLVAADGGWYNGGYKIWNGTFTYLIQF